MFSSWATRRTEKGVLGSKAKRRTGHDTMIVTRDDREGCRSLICDSNGIIIAEMVYRCMICAYISDSISDGQKHYQVKHIDNGPQINNSSPPPEPMAMPQDEYEEEEEEEEEAQCSEDGDGYGTVTFNVPSGLKQLHQQFGSSDEEGTPKPPLKRFGAQSAAGYAASAALAKAKSTALMSMSAESASRGGFVTCAVCNITKFYASVQRRYGQFTCMGCAKFFGRFLLKPRKYCCPNLGSCPLDVSPRCKACLLQACIDTYNIDEKRMLVVNANRPIRKLVPGGQQQSSPTPQQQQQQVTTTGSQLMTSLINPNPVKREPIASNSVLGRSQRIRASPVKKVASLSPSGRPPRTSANGSAVLALLSSTGKKQWGCRKCPGCLVEDCGKCNYCLDKPKFGGPNTLKKKCINRKCMFQTNQRNQKVAAARFARK